MKKIATMLALCALLSAQPQKKAAIQRFGESDLQVIKTQVAISTLIEFPKEEELAEVTIGDKEFWVVEGKGRFIHIKPSKIGLTTNLNVILKSDKVYSFLLKEVSKSWPTKEKPDFKIVIPAEVDEVALLRKHNDKLEELVSKYEDDKKKLEKKIASQKKEAEKKTNDEGPLPKVEKVAEVPARKSEAAIPEEKPRTEAAPKPTTIPPTAAPQPVLPQQPAQTPGTETAAFKSTPVGYVQHRVGVVEATGRFFGWFARRVRATFRLY